MQPARNRFNNPPAGFIRARPPASSTSAHRLHPRPSDRVYLPVLGLLVERELLGDRHGLVCEENARLLGRGRHGGTAQVRAHRHARICDLLPTIECASRPCTTDPAAPWPLVHARTPAAGMHARSSVSADLAADGFLQAVATVGVLTAKASDERVHDLRHMHGQIGRIQNVAPAPVGHPHEHIDGPARIEGRRGAGPVGVCGVSACVRIYARLRRKGTDAHAPSAGALQKGGGGRPGCRLRLGGNDLGGESEDCLLDEPLRRRKVPVAADQPVQSGVLCARGNRPMPRPRACQPFRACFFLC